MAVLVAWASKHGATQEIAERLAQTLTAAGQQAQARDADHLARVPRPDPVARSAGMRPSRRLSARAASRTVGA